MIVERLQWRREENIGKRGEVKYKKYDIGAQLSEKDHALE